MRAALGKPRRGRALQRGNPPARGRLRPPFGSGDVSDSGRWFLDAVGQSGIGIVAQPRPTDVFLFAKIRVLCTPSLFGAGVGVGIRDVDGRRSLAERRVHRAARRRFPARVTAAVAIRPKSAGAIAVVLRPSSDWPGPRPTRSSPPPNSWRPSPTTIRTNIRRRMNIAAGAAARAPLLLPPDTPARPHPEAATSHSVAKGKRRGRPWFSGLQVPWDFDVVDDHRGSGSVGGPSCLDFRLEHCRSGCGVSHLSFRRGVLAGGSTATRNSAPVGQGSRLTDP